MGDVYRYGLPSFALCVLIALFGVLMRGDAVAADADDGHAEGDRHIINAARIISGSLGALGRCFRTGGDEFIAVAGTTDTAEVSRALEKLERLSEEYNRTEAPPVPMRIACGYAVFVPGKDRLDDVEKLADDRMYERKRAMKQSEPA